MDRVLVIGTFAERPTTQRQLSTWLSPQDAVELFWRCLVAPDIGFIVVYGTSATERGWGTPARSSSPDSGPPMTPKPGPRR